MTNNLPTELQANTYPGAPFNQLQGTLANGEWVHVCLQYRTVSHQECTNMIGAGGACGGCDTLTKDDREQLLDLAKKHYANEREAQADPAPVKAQVAAPRSDGIGDVCPDCRTYCYGDCKVA